MGSLVGFKRAAFVVAVATLVPGVTTAPASAQSYWMTPIANEPCQTRALPLDTTVVGELSPTDCRFPTLCDECVPQPPGEFWLLDVAPHELIAITITAAAGVAMRFDSDSPVASGSVRMDGERCACRRRWLRAGATGLTHRFLAEASGSRFGTYAIRAERVTTPLPAATYVDNLGVFWEPHLARSPILEYVIEVGRSPGAADIGIFALGLGEADGPYSPYRRAYFRAVPAGTYFFRIRARSADGWGAASTERVFISGELPRVSQYLFGDVNGRTVSLYWNLSMTSRAALYHELLVGSVPGGVDLGVHRISGVIERVQSNLNPNYQSAAFVDVPPGVYYVRVRAVTDLGVTEPTNEVRVVVY